MKRRLLLALSLLAGCRCNSDPTAKPVGTTQAEEDVIVPALPPMDIGLLGLPSSSGGGAYDEGVALYGKRDFMGARRVLTTAVAAAPDFQAARFKLACAHAKVGAHDDAAKELTQLLSADYRDYQGRIGREDDLAQFRATPAGLALRRRMREIEAAYDDAAKRGLRMFMWKGWTEPRNLVLHTDVLRLGVYLPDTKRFVPLTPGVPDAYAIAVDADASTEVVVELTLNPINGSGSALGERIDRCGISIATFEAPAAPRIRWEGKCFEGLLVAPEKSAARFAHLRSPPGPYTWSRVTREGTKETDQTMPTQYLEARVTGVRGTAGWGVPWPSARAAQFNGKGVLVDGGAPIAIDATHLRKDAYTFAWSSPDGRAVLVVTNIETSDLKGPGGRAIHIVSLVDLDKREATILHEGDGPGHAAFGAEGTVYLQTDRKLRRRAPASTKWEPMPGLLLAQPYVVPVRPDAPGGPP
jgi:hypothetical protein